MHIAVTGALAVVIFIAVTIIGFHHHGIGFLRLFVPHGVPLPLLFFLVPIEVISYLIRPFTLSLRLFANMSKRLERQLVEAVATGPPRPLRDVRAAQKAIADKAKAMETSGEIVLRREKGDIWV